jgi:hypothetical protein
LVINLEPEEGSLRIRSVKGISRADVAKACWLVEKHREFLLAYWRGVHE